MDYIIAEQTLYSSSSIVQNIVSWSADLSSARNACKIPKVDCPVWRAKGKAKDWNANESRNYENSDFCIYGHITEDSIRILTCPYT